MVKTRNARVGTQPVRSARKPRDSRAELFAAAATAFATLGYDAARVDRIAAAAGVNKAMLYYHFGSKRRLYLAVLRDVFGAVSAKARAIADGPGSPVEKMDAWIAAVVDEAGARPWFPPIMMRELAAAGPHFDANTLALMNAIFAGVRDMLAEGQRAGVFRPVDPLLTHMTIMPAILTFFIRTRLAQTHSDAGELGAPRSASAFVTHMQACTRAMLRSEP